MTRARCLFAALVGAYLAIVTTAAAEDDKTAEVCVEAEKRYIELFGEPSSEAASVTVVLMYKYKFCPGELTIPVGTTVRWVNVDKRTSHSVIVQDEPESDRAFPEESIEFTFKIPGSQDYLCGPHWERRDMIGRITVTE